jgi:hypothetical protein
MTTYKVHLDGYNLMPVFKGENEWPRREFVYLTDRCKQLTLCLVNSRFSHGSRTSRQAGAVPRLHY